MIHDKDELRKRCAELLPEFNKLLIEEYVDGREFTVLIAAAPEGPLAFTPFEFVFDTAEHFKTYRMKVTEHHVTNNVPVTDAALNAQLKEMATKIFRAFDAESYARIDIRANQAGKLFFLEINCECSIFYPEGSEGSADYILKHEAIGHAGFLRMIIDDGIRRHQQRQKRFDVKLAADGHVGCFAARELAPGEPVPAGPFRKSLSAANLTGREDKFLTGRLLRKGEELLVAAGA